MVDRAVRVTHADLLAPAETTAGTKVDTSAITRQTRVLTILSLFATVRPSLQAPSPLLRPLPLPLWKASRRARATAPASPTAWLLHLPLLSPALSLLAMDSPSPRLRLLPRPLPAAGTGGASSSAPAKLRHTQAQPPSPQATASQVSRPARKEKAYEKGLTDSFSWSTEYAHCTM